MLRRRSRTIDAPQDPPPRAPQVPSSEARWPEWPTFPPDRYLGQLTDAFQARLAAERAGIRREDCQFYHYTELPDGEVLPGAWDLRNREQIYLGNVDVAGRRVLELGPASGALTRWMESKGAEVVCFEAGFDRSIDLLPYPGREMASARDSAMVHGVAEVQRSWWYLHQLLGWRAKMVYGNIYALPGDLGRFDVAVFGSILLHLRDPFSALAQAAELTDGALVVTDAVQFGLDAEDQGLMRFDPLATPEGNTNWWALSPGAIKAMMWRLGFQPGPIVRHNERHHLGHQLDEPAVDMDLYTIVGTR